MLAEKLNMNPEEAECWIVNLIRNARLDAKIDSKLGHVVMGGQPLSPYQQLIEKIDSLAVRSEALAGLVDRKHKAKNQDVSLYSYFLKYVFHNFYIFILLYRYVGVHKNFDSYFSLVCILTSFISILYMQIPNVYYMLQ